MCEGNLIGDQISVVFNFDFEPKSYSVMKYEICPKNVLSGIS